MSRWLSVALRSRLHGPHVPAESEAIAPQPHASSTDGSCQGAPRQNSVARWCSAAAHETVYLHGAIVGRANSGEQVHLRLQRPQMVGIVKTKTLKTLVLLVAFLLRAVYATPMSTADLGVVLVFVGKGVGQPKWVPRLHVGDGTTTAYLGVRWRETSDHVN